LRGLHAVYEQLTTVDYEFFIPIYFSKLKPEVFFIRVKNCPTVVSIHHGGLKIQKGLKLGLPNV
jgi:hypothetical protein